jgi:monovalent cation/hydrogen antiporter
MILTIQILVLLLAVVAAVAVLANRLKIPPAILLVLTGVLLALILGLPSVELAPELVRSVFSARMEGTG